MRLPYSLCLIAPSLPSCCAASKDESGGTSPTGVVNLLSDLCSSHSVCDTRLMSTPPTHRYKNHRFPAEIIGHGVWLYFRCGNGCLNGHERGAGTDPRILTLNFPLLSALAIAWRSPRSVARVRLCSSEELSIQRNTAACEVRHLRPTFEFSFRAAGPHRGLLVWEYQAAKRRRVHTSGVACPEGTIIDDKLSTLRSAESGT
jgi:hypothetical protein